MTVRNIIPEGVAESQIRRAFANIGYALDELSVQDRWCLIDDHTDAALTTGEKDMIYFPWACRLTAWVALADRVGSVQVDFWKSAFADYPPTDASSICGANEMLISNAQSAQDASLTDWTIQMSAGDCLIVNVDSCTTIRRMLAHFTVERS